MAIWKEPGKYCRGKCSAISLLSLVTHPYKKPAKFKRDPLWKDPKKVDSEGKDEVSHQASMDQLVGLIEAWDFQ